MAKQNHWKPIILISLISLFILSCSQLYVKGPRDSWENVVEHIKPSTVKVFVGDINPVNEEPVLVGNGSGFVAREDGIIVTAAHVVEITEELWRPWVLVVFHDEVTYLVQSMSMSIKDDIAVLKVNAKDLPALKFEKETLVEGEPVLTMGCSSFSDWSVTCGIVSKVDLAYDEELEHGWIQMTAAVNHGYSGGPVVNARGRVVGVSVAFAVKSNEVYIAAPGPIVQKLIKKLLEK